MYVAKLRRVEIAVHRARESDFVCVGGCSARLLVSGRFHESMKAPAAVVYASVSRLLRLCVTTEKRKMERRKEK